MVGCHPHCTVAHLLLLLLLMVLPWQYFTTLLSRQCSPVSVVIQFSVDVTLCILDVLPYARQSVSYCYCLTAWLLPLLLLLLLQLLLLLLLLLMLMLQC
jgi:hypothetical protein